VLGTPQSKITHDSDLVPVRRRAKLLYKRFKDEKNKFEAKKVLEAFEMIKANLKGKIGEGQHKLIGRSRKERELDKHFNHQTKEIKKDKGLKRTLRRAMDGGTGEKRVRLRGDKERVARPRRRDQRKHQKKKHRLKKKQRNKVDCLQGLQKLKGFLESETKFPKAIPLLNRWVREYMNQDNRGHIFEVLHQLAVADYVIDKSDTGRNARQEVIQVFEYVIGYFASWFDEAENHQMLRWAWQVACVLACQCFTDDAFILSRTIVTLNEVLNLLEKNKDVLQEDDQLEAPGSEIGGMRGLPTPPGSPEEADSPHEAPSPHAAPLGTPAPLASPSVSDNDGDGLMEFYATPSPSDDDEDENHSEDVKEEFKELKLEFKEEFKEEKVEIKEEKGATKVDIKSEAKQARRKVIRKAVEIDSESDVKEAIIDSDKEEVIGSEESVNLVDSEADSGSVYEDLGELSSGSGSDVEYIDFAFRVPSTTFILRWIAEIFVFRCLGTLFAHRGPQWAQGKIDTLFQDVFYRRSVFKPLLQTQIEAWQSRIKVLQKNGGSSRNVGDANANPLESHRPVVDSREMMTVIDSDSNAWAAKQTFDSRDKCGGSRVIR